MWWSDGREREAECLVGCKERQNLRHEGSEEPTYHERPAQLPEAMVMSGSMALLLSISVLMAIVCVVTKGHRNTSGQAAT